MRWYVSEIQSLVLCLFEAPSLIVLPTQVSVPAWFTADTRLGGLSIHLDAPQCFSAEMYATDLCISGKHEDDKVPTHVIYLNFA